MVSLAPKRVEAALEGLQEVSGWVRMRCLHAIESAWVSTQSIIVPRSNFANPNRLQETLSALLERELQVLEDERPVTMGLLSLVTALVCTAPSADSLLVKARGSVQGKGVVAFAPWKTGVYKTNHHIL